MRVAGIPLGVGNSQNLYEKILELLFTGADGSGTFADTSGKGCTISRRNATTIQGNRARFYTDDNLTASNIDTTLFNLSGYDFKIEFNFEIIQLENDTIIYGTQSNGATSLQLYIASDGNLKLIKDNVVLFDFGALSLLTIYNVIIERVGNTMSLKINSIEQTLLNAFTTINLDMANFAGIFGSNQYSSSKQRLYMDNIVISRKTLTI